MRTKSWRNTEPNLARQGPVVASSLLSTRLIVGRAPRPAIRWTRNLHQAHPMIFRGAGGIADNDDMIARLECVSRHTLLAELHDAAPFHVPSHHLPARVLNV